MLYIASLNDQVVPIYSGFFTAISHPLILCALYIDGDAYKFVYSYRSLMTLIDCFMFAVLPIFSQTYSSYSSAFSIREFRILDWLLVLCTARLGLKAAALAWLEPAPALSNLRPSQSRYSRLGSGLAWPRPRLLYVKFTKNHIFL